MDYYQLLQNYTQLWNNRKVEQTSQDPKEVLQELIARELNDELTHPRLRKTIHEKFALAIGRVLNSELSNGEKLLLIQAFHGMLEQQKK